MHPRLHRKIDSNTEGESKNRNSLIHFDERNISTPFAIPNKTFLVQSDVLGDRMIESLKVNQKCYEELLTKVDASQNETFPRHGVHETFPKVCIFMASRDSASFVL